MTGDTQSPEQRLARQGLTLPDPPAAGAAFAPYVRSGSTVYVSGQIAVRGGQLVTRGRLGADVDAAGSLSAIARLVKIAVFVASTPDFTSQPQVADGASRLLLDVLGEAGAHARSAIGVAALPLGTPVEVEAIAELGS